jgi:hypothetical protein
MEEYQMLGHRSKLLVVATAFLASITACSQGTAGAASKLTSGAEQFQSVVTSVASFDKGGTSSLIATGVIAGGGRAVTVTYGDSWTAIVKLAAGTFTFSESKGRGTHHLDQRTCIFTQHWSGSFKVSHGSGKYAGISGRGIYRFDWLMAAPRSPSGTCAWLRGRCPAASRTWPRPVRLARRSAGIPWAQTR